MSFFLLAIAIAIGVTWWWISRVPVTPPQVAMMAMRIAFPGGIRLNDPDAALAKLEKRDEIVIPFAHATLVIDFPLSVPASVRITSSIPYGFTRAELVKSICEEYATIYEGEEGSAATKTIPTDERGDQRERNRTDGAFGIWGHDLQDLVLKAVRWSRNVDGKVTIELVVESSPMPAPPSRTLE